MGASPPGQRASTTDQIRPQEPHILANGTETKPLPSLMVTLPVTIRLQARTHPGEPNDRVRCFIPLTRPQQWKIRQ